MSDLIASIPMLRECRSRDAYKWLGTKLDAYETSMAIGNEDSKVVISVPASQLTASIVAARGYSIPYDNRKEWLSARYESNSTTSGSGILIFTVYDFANGCSETVTLQSINPDPLTFRSEWNRQEIDEILKEIQ